MDPRATILLPPIHLEHESTTEVVHRQSVLRSPPQTSPATSSIPRAFNRHCNDPECFIWTPLSREDRWHAFDAFDPSQLDDYGYSSYSLHSQDARRVKRVADLKSRAKARLMPYSLQFRALRRVSEDRQSKYQDDVPRYTFKAPPRTPSPSPMTSYTLGGENYEPSSPFLSIHRPQTPPPKTPIRSGVTHSPRSPLTPTQTPTSTIASSPSPLGSPPVLYIRPSSPCH